MASISSRTMAGQPGGFSYLWVLLIVAFMGLGLTVAIDVYATVSQRDKEKELLSIGRQFRSAIGNYYESQQFGGRMEYPTMLEDLLLDNRYPGIKRHLRKMFVDPLTGKVEWGVIRVRGRIVGIHSLSEKTPIKQDMFEVDDAGFKGKQKIAEWVFTYPSALIQGAASNASSLEEQQALPSIKQRP